MADYACLARDAGARIIGGCCGTTPLHIKAMADALASRPEGPRPDIAMIERALGPLAAEAAAPRQRTRRRAG
jgi:5-methyltetrahydrofolate--homocysteine methyltransferase